MFDRHNLAIALAVVWLALIGFGFWWFQFRWIQDFDRDGRILQSYPSLDVYASEVSDQLSPVSADAAVTVWVVRSEGCRCNRFSLDHLNDLAQRYGDTAQFVYRQLADLPPAFQSLVPATPFAAIQNANGELLYAGPINTGLECTSGSSLLEGYLKPDGNRSLQLPLLARGCYCSL
ncbi:DUF6436 domain-containing protein [Saccharospirillum mangrovi]|uniref:DUF6436 domain-containing protein n=1 Tax=Saccharospirillum mangrovi TaxID=2161747 RepID=UPI000D336D70|nr:DUF6436 domain-containing protein [Saccharospirillum mangrovi]